MKRVILRFLNFVLVSILACFGVSSTRQVMAMYGVPAGEFQVSGRVLNLKNKPIRNIEVEVQDLQKQVLGNDVTLKDGSFEIDYKGWPHREVYLIVSDVDGWRNRGNHLADTTLVKFDYPQNGWNQGRAKVNQDITLSKSKKKIFKY